ITMAEVTVALLLLASYLILICLLWLRAEATAGRTLADLEARGEDDDHGSPLYWLAEKLSAPIERARSIFEGAGQRRWPLVGIGIGIGAVAALVLVLLLAARLTSASNARPPASSVEVTIPGTAAPTSRTGEGMQATGLILQSGSSVSVTASGQV